MDEPVYFGGAVEGLFGRALGPRLDAAARERIREAGIDLGKPPLPAYPVAVWERAFDVAARVAFPGVPEEEAWFQTGRAYIAGFGQTLLGRAVLGVARAVGVERALARMTRNMRSTNNLNDAHVVRSAPGEVEIRVTTTPAFRDFPRGGNLLAVHYVRGVMHAMAEAVGAREVKVEVLEAHPTRRDSRFLVTWRP